MSNATNLCIANNMIDSLRTLLDADVEFQKVYVPQGPGKPTAVRRRIIIEHNTDDE